MVDSWPEFKRKVIEDIFGFQTERKKAQFRKRLSLLRTSTAETASKLCPLFSSQSAAKLFGYKSDHTGWKYRERYFDIVPEPTVVRLKETSDGYPYLQADCKRIYLKTIYH